MPASKLTNRQKFNLLLWKSFYTQWRHPVQMCLILLIPMLLSFQYIVLRHAIPAEKQVLSTYKAINMSEEWNELKEILQNRSIEALKIDSTFTSNVYIPIMTLTYAPDNDPTVNKIMEMVQSKLNTSTVKFADCATLKKKMASDNYLAGVCFEKEPLKNLNYTIYLPSEQRIYHDTYIGADWSTNESYDLRFPTEIRVGRENSGGYVGYVREGFIPLQNAISSIYIVNIKNITKAPAGVLIRFPFRGYIDDNLISDCQIIISLVILGGYLIPVLQLVKVLVWEKEIKRRQLLRNMGLPNGLQVTSWCVIGFIFFFIVSMVFISLLKIPVDKSKTFAMLSKSSMLILLIVFLIYNIASISFCVMISSFFNKTSKAVISAGIIWIVSFIPFMPAVNSTSIGIFTKLFMYLSMNTVLGLTFNRILSLEEFHDGVQWANLFKSRYKNDNWSVGVYMVIMFGLALLYFLIAFCVETDWKRVSWFKRKKRHGSTKRLSSGPPIYNEISTTDVTEKERESVIPTVSIKDVKHQYKGKTVLKGISMNLYENEIVVLMGHNGAGKSTLISLLTGMEKLQEGKIIIGGVDTSQLSGNVYNNMGILNEKAQFLEEFTVADQLMFFGRIRGMRHSKLPAEIKRYLEAMHMQDKSNVLIKKLTPGCRRQLAVLCALIGESKFIILDDPTTGIDYDGCRLLWEILQAEKKKRTILITSHSANEAESLADRVAIMSAGELKCIGSTIFIKNFYGRGFRLTFLKHENSDTVAVTQLLKNHIPDILPELNLGRLLTFKIDEKYVNELDTILDELESKKLELQIESYSVDEASIEDIFLELGTENHGNNGAERHQQISNGETMYGKDIDDLQFIYKRHKLGSCKVITQKWIAMILKNFYAQDHKFAAIVVLLMPFILTYLPFILTQHWLKRNFLKPISFSLKQYPQSITLYQHITPSKQNLRPIYEKIITGMGKTHETEETNYPKLFYTAIEKQTSDIDFFNHNYLIGHSLGIRYIKSWFNNYVLHTAPLSLNVAHNVALGTLKNENASIEVNFEPLPYTGPISIALVPKYNFVIYLLAYNVAFMLIFQCTRRVISLVNERQQHFTLHQFIAGMRVFTFWLPTFLYDFLGIMIMSSLIVGLCGFTGHSILSTSTVLVLYWLLLLAAGVAITSFNYLLLMCFKDAINAYIVLIGFYTLGIVTGLGTLNEIYPHFHEDVDELRSVLLIHPTYSLIEGLIRTFEVEVRHVRCNDKNVQLMSSIENCTIVPHCCKLNSVWCMGTGIGANMVTFVTYTAISWILIFIIDNFKYGKRLRCCCPIRKDNYSSAYEEHHIHHADNPHIKIDDSVVYERVKVQTLHPSERRKMPLTFDRVGKNFGKQKAIHRLHLTIERAECFGVLGVSGSGKSVILKILAGELNMSFGSLKVYNTEMKKKMFNIYKNIGYCPQLPLQLDYRGYQILRIYCLIYGVPMGEIRNFCESLSRRFGFDHSLDKPLKEYSSGILKRFHLAVAILGNPSLLYLDQPTTTVDLAGRRLIYNIICTLRGHGTVVVLTSVSATECIYICNRVAILYAGRFQVIGPPLALCEKHMNGYLLKIKMKRHIQQSHISHVSARFAAVDPYFKVTSYVQSNFLHSIVREIYGDYIVFLIPLESATMSKITRAMRKDAPSLLIEHFYITRNTLAQVFMHFAREQFDLLESRKNGSKLTDA